MESCCRDSRDAAAGISIVFAAVRFFWPIAVECLALIIVFAGRSQNRAVPVLQEVSGSGL